MTDIETLARKALRRCRLVSAGVDELIGPLAPALPFAGGDLAALSLDERTAALAFLKRFEQLQDLTGRLCRITIAFEGEDATELTQRDLGNWLSKDGFVGETVDWLAMSRLRNRLVHEYPLEEEEQVSRLNHVWAFMPALRTITGALDDHLVKKGLTP